MKTSDSDTHASAALPAAIQGVDSCIVPLRGLRVILDIDLARLYGVPAFALRQAVRRNRDRFPEDFLFRLTIHEMRPMASRISALAEPGWGGRRTRPLAFTEEGVAMLSSVLRSPLAVRVSVEIVRAFVRQRRLLMEHADLTRKVEELESRYDGQFGIVFEALRGLMEIQESPQERIGFSPEGP